MRSVTIIASLFLVTCLHHAYALDACDMADSIGKVLQSCGNAGMTCPDGWAMNPLTGSCYLLIESEFEWYDARAQCTNLGADMVVLNNKAEMGFVYDYVSSARETWLKIWVGLERFGSEWRWVDGSPLTIAEEAFWLDGRTPENNTKDAAVMRAPGLIRDRNRTPDIKCYVLCEKHL
ncbi:C-type lectin domain family 4 member M-like [Diadema antillarum]|uniref:C-type lectin domain family 4 member M-like n=1 Tax=Diadema antillarum TaxID=105358 RepID=UPI003A87EE19